MGDEPKKVLTKIRTFAQDLEQHKGKGIPAITKEEVSVPPTPPEMVVVANKLKAPEVFKNPTPFNTTPPAFHELHKKSPQHTDAKDVQTPTSFMKAPSISEAKFDEHVEVPKNPKKRSTSYTEATIITDTKKNKVNVVTSSASSLSLWWKEFLKGLKRKEPPKYTVADVERRKGVIQKATSKTATIFTADSETLKEEIRRRQLNSTQSEMTDAGEHSSLLWSPNTEPGYPLLPTTPVVTEPVQNVAVTFKKRSVPPPVIIEPSIPRPLTAIPSETMPVIKEIVAPVLEVKTSTLPPIGAPSPYTPPPLQATTWTTPFAPISIPQSIEDDRTLLETSVVNEAVQTVPEEAPVSPKLTFHFGNFDRVNTNRLSLSIVGILGGAIIAVFLIRVGMEIFNPETTQMVTNEPAVALSSGSQIVDLPVSSLSQTSIDAALTLVPQTSLGISEIRLLDQATDTVIPTQEILRYFNFETNPNFNQSVVVIHLTLINNERALLLRVTDATTVFGALLEWEPKMAADVASLLQIQTAPTNERFTDGTLGQSDIRILTVNNTETLVYGFIDKNTVLIAKNQTAFTDLANRQ